jgi:hypothetical protein
LPYELENSLLVFDATRLGSVYSAIGNVLKNFYDFVTAHYNNFSMKIIFQEGQKKDIEDQFIGYEGKIDLVLERRKK